MAQILNKLVSANHRPSAEGTVFDYDVIVLDLGDGTNEVNTTLPENPWDWNDFYYYFSLEGLTTAHENQPSTHPYDYKENEMDLFNNDKGRLIAFN